MYRIEYFYGDSSEWLCCEFGDDPDGSKGPERLSYYQRMIPGTPHRLIRR